jgi:hypothetical protein
MKTTILKELAEQGLVKLPEKLICSFCGGTKKVIDAWGEEEDCSHCYLVYQQNKTKDLYDNLPITLPGVEIDVEKVEKILTDSALNECMVMDKFAITIYPDDIAQALADRKGEWVKK